jgi:hypothetical protein
MNYSTTIYSISTLRTMCINRGIETYYNMPVFEMQAALYAYDELNK